MRMERNFVWKSWYHSSIAIARPVELGRRRFRQSVGWCAVCSVRVSREKISAQDDLSACFYSLGGPVVHETWRRRQPAKFVAFQRLVQEWADTGVLAEEITKVNYPFDYDPRSSF